MVIPKIIMLTPFPNSSVMTQFPRDEYKQFTDMTVVGTDNGIELPTNWNLLERNHGPILEKAEKIEKKGDCDVLILGCFGDPVIEPVRQVVSMPVLGPGHTSLAVATMMGRKIGVISIQEDFVILTEQMIDALRFRDHVAGEVRVAEENCAEMIQTKPDDAVKVLTEVCLKSIRDDGADVVIFGCIGLAWMINRVRDAIAKQGFRTPIIEPGVTVYRAAKMIAELGLNQDRRKLAVT